MHHRSHDHGSLHPGGLHLGWFASRGVCIQEGSASTGGPGDPVGLGRPPRYMGYYGIRSTSGWYASYWNLFLFVKKFFQDPPLKHFG